MRHLDKYKQIENSEKVILHFVKLIYPLPLRTTPNDIQLQSLEVPCKIS